MHRPTPRSIGGDSHRQSFAGLHQHGVKARLVWATPILQIHPHSVEVYWVLHHRVIDENEAKSLAVAESDGGGGLRILLAVE